MKQPIATKYFNDFLAYYKRAAALEAQNHRGAPKRKTGDALQDHVSIYDTVHRRYAGFSNVLRDLKEPGRYNATARWKLREWLFVYGVHRMTGSGASFFPKSEGERRHGYCNVIAPSLGSCKSIDDMAALIKGWNQPMFTSHGNQPPPFPKPIDGYDQGGRYFFCEVWPSFVDIVASELEENPRAQSIADFTDWMLSLNVVNGFKRFKFTYTAFVMDIADWHPKLMDPLSQCHYGANCITAFNAMFSGDNRTKGKNFYHACMAELVPHCSKILGEPAAPMDIEDVACDAVRYWSRFVPRHGYADLTTQQRETKSAITMSEFEEFCRRV